VSLGQGFSTGVLGPLKGAKERFSEGHEQRPLLSISAVILQNPIDEQGGPQVLIVFGRGSQTIKG